MLIVNCNLTTILVPCANMTNQELWHAVLGELELSLSKPNFTTWFKNTDIIFYENGKIVVSVPNGFTKAWLEKKYNQAITKSFQSILQRNIVSIEYRVEIKPRENHAVGPINFAAANANKTILREEQKYEPHEIINPFGIRTNYTFENFVVGKNSELAYAAAQAVVANPGEIYNPLFIYGGVGLGKTHLLHAIGNRILKKFPHFKPLYVTCEKFTNDFIRAVQSGHGHVRELKDKYRNIDFLLIDDIQFIAGKEGTQEELHNTFNALYQANKHIVLSSDRPPKAIPALEERLISRFGWGLIADISMPDVETRTAILEEKCAEKNYNLEKSIIQYIAQNIQSNIRELESVLNKIIAYHELQHITPTIEMVKGIIAGFIQNTQKITIPASKIIQAISAFYELSIDELMGQSREKKVALPRQILMYLLREENKLSFPDIGKEIGDRDHTTVLHAHRKISREIKDNNKIKNDIEIIRNKLYAQPII